MDAGRRVLTRNYMHNGPYTTGETARILGISAHKAVNIKGLQC